MPDPAINILRIDSSGRHEGSQTRQLTDEFVDSLKSRTKVEKVTVRDVSQGIEFVDQDWVFANFTDETERSEEQVRRLANSDQLVDELQEADLIVIGAPVYNFGIPAALKAWVDQVARARKTFQYTENGPVGLLKNKRAVIVTASGGTTVGSEIDFATPYLVHVLGFLGIHDVEVIKAERLMVDADSGIANAKRQIQSFQLDTAA
ncbi:MAG: NAD(P)H-dependent oxidoreductase [Pseudomonadota bacterium]